MTSPFIGEIQMFGFNFNPRGWAFCNGATLPIAQNTALFSLLGTTYGGNGTSTFQLPNFSARAACQQGTGAGLTHRQMGEHFGVSSVSLTENQMATHNHGVVAFFPSDSSKRSNAPVANGGLSMPGNAANRAFSKSPPTITEFAPNMLGPSTGNGDAHENRQPYLAVNFCIALQGIFPSFT